MVPSTDNSQTATSFDVSHKFQSSWYSDTTIASTEYTTGTRYLSAVYYCPCPEPLYEEFVDQGPDMDIRSWAFIEKQTKLLNKTQLYKKFLFRSSDICDKIFKSKSMDSRSGYRGIKRIRK